ncbi:glycosyltransferase family 39 protein [Ancylobacter sp. 6x-1]|uniref:Glycosyltransferase family 39 protein n=1 Tax=Ancylobacter crimeensis TaxID=2579147 RepID=A0ABT0D9H9_9HYPH|nr:glycosyltransferase family 39 protein [Ancylobacter crimeensis]MCK0196606.1 glycosyltransferase family 39 protein [Ancylobacter crimeensis]
MVEAAQASAARRGAGPQVGPRTREREGWVARLVSAGGIGLARVALLALCLAAWLPGLASLPAVDRDEARFAQASRQMLASGDFVTPRLGEDPRFKKPIGIYWLQTASATLTGHGDGAAPIWTLRLPSLIAACLAVLLTHTIGLRLFGPRAAFAGAALLASCLVLGGEAHLAKTDATQLAAALAGQLALMWCYLARPESPRRLGPALLFWAAMGFGIMIKGPIVPLLAGGTVLGLLAMDRKAAWLKRLRPTIGVPVMLAIVLPWVIAIFLASGTDFFHESVGNDLLGKVASGQESHGLPPGAHLLAFFVAFWPGAALAVAGLPWVWANRALPAVRFCIAWIVPFWIVFELIATKLPHYTLPAYPAIALLAGAAACARGGVWPRWTRVLVILAAFGGLAGAFALPTALVWFEGSAPVGVLLLAWAAGALALVGAWLALGGAMGRAYGCLIACAVLLYGLGFGIVAPQIRVAWLAPRLAEAVAKSACPAPEVMVSGFNEASALFALGKDTRFGDGAAAADFLGEPGCRVAAVSDRQQAAFAARLAALGLAAPSLLDTVTGFNTGNGHLVTMSVYAGAAP